MSNQRHIIQRQELLVEINTEDEQNAYAIQQDTVNLLKAELNEKLDKLFSELCEPHEVIRLDQLSIDIGSLQATELEEAMVDKVIDAVRKEITARKSEARKASVATAKAEQKAREEIIRKEKEEQERESASAQEEREKEFEQARSQSKHKNPEESSESEVEIDQETGLPKPKRGPLLNLPITIANWEAVLHFTRHGHWPWHHDIQPGRHFPTLLLQLVKADSEDTATYLKTICLTKTGRQRFIWHTKDDELFEILSALPSPLQSRSVTYLKGLLRDLRAISGSGSEISLSDYEIRNHIWDIVLQAFLVPTQVHSTRGVPRWSMTQSFPVAGKRTLLRALLRQIGQQHFKDQTLPEKLEQKANANLLSLVPSEVLRIIYVLKVILDQDLPAAIKKRWHQSLIAILSIAIKESSLPALLRFNPRLPEEQRSVESESLVPAPEAGETQDSIAQRRASINAAAEELLSLSGLDLSENSIRFWLARVLKTIASNQGYREDTAPESKEEVAGLTRRNDASFKSSSQSTNDELQAGAESTQEEEQTARKKPDQEKRSEDSSKDSSSPDSKKQPDEELADKEKRKKASEDSSTLNENELSDQESPPEEDLIIDGLLVQNAGIVLTHPYLIYLFAGIEYLNEDKQFKDEASRIRAIHLVHYMACKSAAEEEHDLLVPKLICGLPPEQPVPLDITLTETELIEGEHILSTVLERWPLMKTSSPDALRQNFLIREALISKDESEPDELESWTLRMDKTTIDLLMDRIPWGISSLKAPYSDFLLNVDW